jgi:hypothetical protein
MTHDEQTRLLVVSAAGGLIAIIKSEYLRRTGRKYLLPPWTFTGLFVLLGRAIWWPIGRLIRAVQRRERGSQLPVRGRQ